MKTGKGIAGLGAKTLAIMLALIVVASAATVAYLSNAALMSANVISPFEIRTTGTTFGTCGATSCDLAGLHGGDTFTVTGTLENKANNAVYAATKVICSDGASTMDCLQLALSHNYTIVAEPTVPAMVGYASGSTQVPCTDVAGTAVYTVQAGYSFPAGHLSADQFDGTLVGNFTGSLACTLQALPA